MIKKREIRIIAIDNRYKQYAYPFRPVYDERINTYLTGQHIDPTDDKTRGNLTKEEMLGQVPLSDEKRKKFSYVINPSPENVFPISNMRRFELSTYEDGTPTNPKDFWEFNMIKHYSWFIAPSRTSVVSGKDYFYINDVEQAAKETVSKEDLIYDATKFIREECTMDKYKEVALLLNYKISQFNIDVDNMSEVMVRSELYKACKEYPEEVLSCKGDGSNQDLFILKLAAYNIIKRNGDDFYDGPMFIGKGLSGVKAFMANIDKQMYVSKWKNLIEQKEGKASFEDITKTKLSEELREEYKHLDIEELKKICGSKRLKKIEWEEMTSKEDVIEYLISKLK